MFILVIEPACVEIGACCIPTCIGWQTFKANSLLLVCIERFLRQLRLIQLEEEVADFTRRMPWNICSSLLANLDGGEKWRRKRIDKARRKRRAKPAASEKKGACCPPFLARPVAGWLARDVGGGGRFARLAFDSSSLSVW